MYLNKAIIFGNLTRDPELKSIPSGTQVASFSLATNRVWKDASGAKQENTDFHNVVVFGRQAETVSQYLKKGSSCLVEGRIQSRSWDAPDGTKRYRTEIIAERVQFGPRGGEQGQGAPRTQKAPATEPAQDAGGGQGAVDYPEEEINPDDIPF